MLRRSPRRFAWSFPRAPGRTCFQAKPESLGAGGCAVKPARLAIARALLIVVGASSPALHVREAHALVVCQKGKKLKLRPGGCTGKEARVPLDADTLRGMTPEELLAPLSARIQALERLLAVTTTVMTTTTVAVTTSTIS